MEAGKGSQGEPSAVALEEGSSQLDSLQAAVDEKLQDVAAGNQNLAEGN